MVVTKSILKHFFDTTKFKTKKTTKKDRLETDNNNSKEEVAYQTVYHQDELLNNTISPMSSLQSSEETVRPIPIPNATNQQLNLNIQSMFSNFQLTNMDQVLPSAGNGSMTSSNPAAFHVVDQQPLPNQDQFSGIPIDQQIACGSQGNQFYLNTYQNGTFSNFSNSVDSFHASHSDTNSQASSQANSYHGSYLEEAMSAATMPWGNLNPPSAGYASSTSSSCSNGYLGDGVMLNPSLLSASLDTYTGFSDSYMLNPMYQPTDFNFTHSMTDLTLQPQAMYSTSYSSTPNFHPLSPQSIKTEFTSPTQPAIETSHPKYPPHINSKNICPFPGCHKIFSKAYNCSTHYLTHFPNRVRAHVCPVCGRGFDRKYDLGRHMSTKRHHPPEHPPSTSLET